MTLESGQIVRAHIQDQANFHGGVYLVRLTAPDRPGFWHAVVEGAENGDMAWTSAMWCTLHGLSVYVHESHILPPTTIEETLRRLLQNTHGVSVGLLKSGKFEVVAAGKRHADTSLLTALCQAEKHVQAVEDAWQRRRARLHALGLNDDDLYIAPSADDWYVLRRVCKDPSVSEALVEGTRADMDAFVAAFERGDAEASFQRCAYQKHPTYHVDQRYELWSPRNSEWSGNCSESAMAAMAKIWRSHGAVDESYEDAGYPPLV